MMAIVDELKKRCFDKISFLLDKPLSPADVKDVAEAIKTLNEVLIVAEKKVIKKAAEHSEEKH